jgi:hypothetical protein
MSYTDLFHHRPEAEITNRIYIKQPSAITSAKDLEYYSGRASQAIAEAESLIQTMKEYQQALYDRYQEIVSANFHLHLHLERRVHYNNSKTYYVTIAKRFDGNNVADEEVLREVFEGKERHKALKRFEALKKEYPNIENSMDIEKRHWER